MSRIELDPATAALVIASAQAVIDAIVLRSAAAGGLTDEQKNAILAAADAGDREWDEYVEMVRARQA